MTRWLLVAGLLAPRGLVMAATAAPPEQAAFAANLEVANIPTAATLYGRMFHMNMRVFPGGGLLIKALASPNDFITLGLSFKASNVIGTGTPYVDDRPLRAVAKLKVLSLPGARLDGAIGYDDMESPAARSRGAFAVLSKELDFAGLILTVHGGAGLTKFSSPKFDRDVVAFAGATGALTQALVVGIEYDDVLLKDRNSTGVANGFVGLQWDAGLRLEFDLLGLFRGVDRHSRLFKLLYTF